MCIAILSPKGTEITAQQFRNCWDNNFNGAGFMYNDDNNKLHVVKEMDKYERVYKKYSSLRKKFPNATFVLHFRISTHGVINKSNCHPFKVNNELGFVHNGVIRAVEKNDEHSDTNVFNRQILRKIPGMSVEFMENPAIETLFGEFIAHSKLIFMNNFGEATITNEHKGDWEEDGIWYSNDSHKRVKNTVDFGGQTMTREEFNKLQGGKDGSEFKSESEVKPYTSYHNRPGYKNSSWKSSTPSKYYDDSYWTAPSNMNSLKGGLHDTDTVEDLKSSLNNSYQEGDEYIVADGSVPCQTCGVHTLKGELLTKENECLECASDEVQGKAISAAVEDGAILNLYQNTVIAEDLIEFKDEQDEVLEFEAVECDNCTTVVDKKYSRHLADWGCTLCHNCVDDFIKAEAMDESMRIDSPPKMDAYELLFGDDY